MAGARPQTDDRTDGELATLVAAGDREAGQVLVNRYQRLIRSFLLKLSGNRDLADDIAQETFLRMLTHADRFDPKYPMRTWLMTIARRLLINHLRRADTRVGHSEYHGMHSADAGPADAAADHDERGRIKAHVHAALDKLTDTQKASIVLFYQHELSIQEVADVMEMPAGTIKSHLHRARAALRQLLGPQFETVTP